MYNTNFSFVPTPLDICKCVHAHTLWLTLISETAVVDKLQISENTKLTSNKWIHEIIEIYISNDCKFFVFFFLSSLWGSRSFSLGRFFLGSNSSNWWCAYRSRRIVPSGKGGGNLRLYRFCRDTYGARWNRVFYDARVAETGRHTRTVWKDEKNKKPKRTVKRNFFISSKKGDRRRYVLTWQTRP